VCIYFADCFLAFTPHSLGKDTFLFNNQGFPDLIHVHPVVWVSS